MSKEKREMDVQFGSTMEAIVKTMDLAHLSKDSDNPQVFEVKFKLPNMGYSSRSDFYRLVFDPNHLDNLGFAGDSLFLYQGDGFFDKMLGMVGIQKNEKAIIVRQFWFIFRSWAHFGSAGGQFFHHKNGLDHQRCAKRNFP